MNTTIQVDVKTKAMLERLKNTYEVNTYDDAIVCLMKKKTKSLYGSLAKGKRVHMKAVLSSLRAKNDRF